MIAIIPACGLVESRPILASFFFLGLLPVALILAVAQPFWLYDLARIENERNKSAEAISKVPIMGRDENTESEHPYKADEKIITAEATSELDDGEAGGETVDTRGSADKSMLSELVTPFDSGYWWFKSWLLFEQVGCLRVYMPIVSSPSHLRHVPPCVRFKAVFVAMITLWRSGDSERHSAKMQLIASLAWCCVTLAYASWSRAYKENIEDASDIFARCCTVVTLIVGIMLYYEAFGQTTADWILAGTNFSTAVWFLCVLNPYRIIVAARRAIRDKIAERKAGQWSHAQLNKLPESRVRKLTTVELQALTDAQRTWLSEKRSLKEDDNRTLKEIGVKLLTLKAAEWSADSALRPDLPASSSTKQVSGQHSGWSTKPPSEK